MVGPKFPRLRLKPITISKPKAKPEKVKEEKPRKEEIQPRAEKEKAGVIEIEQPGVGAKFFERVPSGINGLDELITGGFEKESTILVCGDAGSGKSTFALQFLYNGAVAHNEPGVYISFTESKENVYRHTRSFGWDFEKLEKEKKFAFVFYKPHEVVKLVKEGGGTIRDTIESLGAKRVVLDSVTAYALLFDSEYRARESIIELFDMLKNWKCTSLVVSEVPVTHDESPASGVKYLVDTILILYHTREESARTRALEVLKMRGSAHSNRFCPFRFEKDGIHIYSREQVFERV
ncbi:MAG: ATPase domain-containing protein [Candidatus Micrarchaeota archaeon]